MVRKCLKNKSKRITCHKRYKILKKVREHHRKVRKEAKKNLVKTTRKDPGVPSNYPFKEEFFKHVEDIKRQVDEVRSYNQTHCTKSITEPEKNPKVSPQDEVSKTINDADVIIEVLDARDPIGTRCIDIEESIIGANKRLILLLNKIGNPLFLLLSDLVPRSNLQSWLDYLRRSRTVLPFRSNTQSQNTYLCVGKMHWDQKVDVTKKQSPKGLGVDDLMSLLANYGRIDGSSDRKHITVGVVGLPNTGKSSLVNTLKRQKVCASGNVPGLTKQSQRIRLDKNIFLIDTPGLLTSRSSDPTELALKNCLRPESLEDPIPAVEAILRRCDQNQLVSKYNIESYKNVTDFVAQLAHRLGKLRKGGLPNLTQAARSLISDWITGKITYFTVPPENSETSASDLQNIQDNMSESEGPAEMDVDNSTTTNQYQFTC